jgi:hypothetical protein
LRDRLKISAGSKKQSMTKRELTAKATQHIPRLRNETRKQSHHHKIQNNTGVREKWNGRHNPNKQSNAENIFAHLCHDKHLMSWPQKNLPALTKAHQ